MENENEMIPVQTQEIRTMSDQTLAALYLIAGVIVAVVSPLIIHSLLGWVLMLVGIIFAFLGICGFATLSQDKKRTSGNK